MFTYFSKTLTPEGQNKLTPEQVKHVQQQIVESKKPISTHYQAYKLLELEEYSNTRKSLTETYTYQRSIFDNVPKKDYIDTKLIAKKKQISEQALAEYNKLLSPTSSLITLQNLIPHLLYENAEINPHAANLFFSAGMQQHHFDRYLELIPCDDFALIPNITILGEEVDKKYMGYKICRLTSDSPEAALLGTYTSCCQSLGQAGEEPTIYGITKPSAGFYVIYDSRHNIVAQCMAWRSDCGSLVFDSIEADVDFLSRNSLMLIDFYTYLANELVKKHHIARVLVGEEGKTPQELGVIKMPSSAFGYTQYSDAKTQRLVACQYFPAIPLFLSRHPYSALKGKVELAEIVMSPKKIMHWCDLSAFNNADLTPEILSYALSLGITEESLNERMQLTPMWIAFLDAIKKTEFLEQKKISDFLDKNNRLVNVARTDKKTIIQLASENKQWILVDCLLRRGADIHHQFDANKKTILHLAVQAGSISTVQLLIDELGDDPNSKMLDGTTPLHIASQENHTLLVHYLIRKKADVNLKCITKEGSKSAISFAIRTDNLEIFNILRSAGADLKCLCSFYNDSPFMELSRTGCLSIIKYLYGENHTTRPTTSYMNTLIVNALECGHWKVAEYWINLGGTVSSDYLEMHAFRSWDILNACLQRGIKIDAQSSFLFELSLSHLLSTNSSGSAVKIFNWLVNEGANFNEKKIASFLSDALSHHAWDFMETLIAYGKEKYPSYCFGDAIINLARKEKITMPASIIVRLLLQKQLEDAPAATPEKFETFSFFSSSHLTNLISENSTLTQPSIKQKKCSLL